MNEHIYKQIELTGSSKTSMEDAVQNAIRRKPRLH
jgi:flavin-binding protein dodecin